jgi:hypothetical protein
MLTHGGSGRGMYCVSMRTPIHTLSMPAASCYTKSVSNFDLQVRLRAVKKDHAETYISAE